MTQWQKVRVGDFLTQRKERIVIDANIEYSLVTISNKGVIKLREKKKGAVISAKTGYIAKTGDFIYSRLSVHTGAFGIVPVELNNALITNEMPCFKINKSQIFPTILIKMIGLPNFIWQLNQLTQGVGRVRIKESMMLSLSLTLPSIKEQKIIVKKLKSIETEENDLKQEITQQQALLKKLRQQILQEAIEGKLTQDWRVKNPKTEPASELLKRIQAEKQQLIKDKKIKAQKPLPAISEDEKPFKLPESWTWCRLRDISNNVHYGANKSAKHIYQGVRLLRITDIQNNKVNWDSVPSCDYSDKDIQNYHLENQDILIARTGGTIGKSYLVENISVKSLFASYLIRVSPNSNIYAKYLKFFLGSSFYWQQLYGAAWGAGQPNVSGTKLKMLCISIPSFAEQKAIVAKVEKLLSICDKLQTQITANQTHAEQLMQAVLKEAFTQSEPPIKLTA